MILFLRIVTWFLFLTALISFGTCHPHGPRAKNNELLHHPSKTSYIESPLNGVVTAVKHVIRVANPDPQKYTRPAITTSTTRYPKYLRKSMTEIAHRATRVQGLPASTINGEPTVDTSIGEPTMDTMAGEPTMDTITGEHSTEITVPPVIPTVSIAPTPSASHPPVHTDTTTTNLRTWYSGTPSEFLVTRTWTTPSAPPCTAGPQPSTTTTVQFDDVPVTWWYGLFPTGYAGLHLRNTFVMDSRIVDLDWAYMTVSKPNFAVHPGYKSNDSSKMGDFDHSGFIALPDGASFDVVSMWVQCDRPCELHLFEQGFGMNGERELLTTTEPGNSGGWIILPGGQKNSAMKLLEMEKIFGKGGGTKLRWLRYWARDTNENPKEWLSEAREVAVAIDDLVLRRRINGIACMEPKG